MAKQDNGNLLIFAVIVVAIVLLSGGLTLNFNFPGMFGGTDIPNPDEIPDTPSGYWVTLSATPQQVCQGDDILITIASNMPNSGCAAFARPATGGWNYLTTVTTNALGGFMLSQEVNLPLGAYTGRVVCGDAAGTFKASNEAFIQVIDCSDGAPPDDGSGGQDGSGSGGGTTPTSCLAVWNPSIANCGAAVCQNTGQECIYYKATMFEAAHCGCATPSCETECRMSAYSSGTCRETALIDGTPIRSPCVGMTRLYSGDVLCGASNNGFGNKACCCS